MSASVDLDRLATRARSGDRAAFAGLVDRLEAPLFHFLSLRTASREDAEELTQETFLRAWKYIERYDPRHSFSTWLFTVGKRLTISAHRKRRLSTVGDEELDRAAASTDAPEPSSILSHREQGQNLWSLARQVLSADQHQALWLRYAEDVDTHEIGRILGKREATVRVILFRARARLAESLPGGSRPASAVTSRERYPCTGSLESGGAS